MPLTACAAVPFSTMFISFWPDLAVNVPLLEKSPPTFSVCVTLPVTLLTERVAPEAIVRPAVTVIVLAVPSGFSVPLVPCPTVRLLTVTFWFIVMVAPLAMVTSSPAPGTTPPDHDAVADQLPVTALLVIEAPIAVEMMTALPSVRTTIVANSRNKIVVIVFI